LWWLYSGPTYLSIARAALLVLEVERVHGLDERGSVGARRRIASIVGLYDGHLSTLRIARAALLFLASGLLALELALGALAVGRLDTLVVAFEFLANRRAFGFGGSAGSVALSRGANGLALGAILLLTIVLRATNGANGAFAMNHTLGTLSLFASHLTLGASTHRVANSRALRIITLPAALRMALFSVHRRYSKKSKHGHNKLHDERKKERKRMKKRAE